MAVMTLGISGFAAYVPAPRVDLERWCEWRGDAWSKVRSVVGSGFRMCSPFENVYTMAATAVCRLIRQFGIDPARVGMLALGTESSTDNSAGAVIIRGLVDRALRASGAAPLSRRCEVPEFKHACLGGVYALKSALRYLAFDGADRCAIVVCADIAEYARGSSGEPTQGAGAVAMLVEREPRLLAVDLLAAGSASDCRGPDFRKPFARYAGQAVAPGRPLKDFPVFNGKYSTTCYLDEVLRAVEGMRFADGGGMTSRWLQRVSAAFLHRPYQRMAETGFAAIWLHALARGDASARAELAALCARAGEPCDAVVAELTVPGAVAALVEDGRIDDDLFPAVQGVIRALRGDPEFAPRMAAPIRFGADVMKQVGNLYSASLPAWMAAGLEQAARDGVDLGEVLAIGYGSGDAAEALPMRTVAGWQDAALRGGIAAGLAGARDLSRDQYEALHDGDAPAIDAGNSEFTICGVGSGAQGYDDFGLEQYQHRPAQ